jgi:DNA-binding transcriptional regulator/RsmH inhibitor MraZ
VDPEQKPVSVEPPRGSFTAHVDEKGRLKLPVSFQEYLGTFGDDRLYVTSTDDRIARIYPLSSWKDSEKALDELALEDPEAAEALLMVTNRYGGDSKVDGQGRVTLPTELRRDLSLESQEVRLDWARGGINVYSMAEYGARLKSSKEKLAEALNAAKKKGFK